MLGGAPLVPPEATKFEAAAAVAAGGKGGEEFLPDEPRMVYVGNLPWSIKWQDLKDHMKAAGAVEFAKVLTADGSEWGRSRGVAYVRYATEAEAKAAVSILNQSELAGRNITVDAWTGAKPRSKGGFSGKGGGKGYFPAFKGGYGFPGKGFPGKGFPGKGGYGGWGMQIKVHGESDQMVYVGNLSYKAEWQELKDHMKTAGTVEFVKILTDTGMEWGRSKGVGCTRYASAAEAANAVQMLNGSEFMGRQIVVDLWAKGRDKEGQETGPP
mmetsp:Transcript_5619/g.11151  ORF Transcript_5619/g.11151 Transcript_5619/m.11151 type:complete len:269 (-) Transcript_5619:46-852(-)